MGRARKAIEALVEARPRDGPALDATGARQRCRSTELDVGDRVLVKPNTRIPADGFVVRGHEQREPGADHRRKRAGRQAPGRRRAAAAHAIPSALAAEHRVFAGTINGAVRA